MGPIHRWDIPAGCEGYFKFLCVRHPVDRCVSYWHQMCHKEPREGTRRDRMDLTMPGASFHEFLRQLIEWRDHGNRKEHPSYMFADQSTYIDHVGPSLILRLETINIDLGRLPFVKGNWKRPEVHNKSKKGWPQPTFNDAVHQYLEEYCRRDMDELGYDGPWS